MSVRKRSEEKKPDTGITAQPPDASRIPKFYKMSIADRVRALHARGLLDEKDFRDLLTGAHSLKSENADRMIENVIGVMGLPLGLGLNFLINNKDYAVPLAVEEPSIVAALSSAAKLARGCGGFIAECPESLLIGQVQLVDVTDVQEAKKRLLARKTEILNLANSLHPRLIARGGGAKDVEVHIHAGACSDGRDMVVLHLLVDTCDAMGANLVNTMCEGVASLVENIAGGKVFLRILSNLTDRSVVCASTTIPVALLADGAYTGEQVRDGIILASDFASVDPYRAATHNKGIMNGVDPVVIATGNDWRAIEAAAHAYAARSGRYTALTRWSRNERGDLVGRIEIPLKLGIVGGPLESNKTAALNLRLLGVKSARELAEVIAAVGLAQNFSALKALATEGIQRGHMTLHARSVAMAAGVPDDLSDAVIERLIDSGEIKVWKAQEILRKIQTQAVPVNENSDISQYPAGHGKVIFFGEHAVVYGSHALAAPVPHAIRARVEDGGEGIQIIIPRWNVEHHLHRDPAQQKSFEKPFFLILNRLGLHDRNMRIEVFAGLPRAMGLGSSAAICVAIIRALNETYDLGLDDAQVNALAFEGERVAHGTPSGIDNTVASFGQFILYRRTGEKPLMQTVKPAASIPVVIGISGIESLTAGTVARVRAAWEQNTILYDRIFSEIDTLTLEGLRAVETGDFAKLGDLMNINHGLLNALQVSTPEIENLVQTARRAGALGAKVTGGGGGGSILALCPGSQDEVAKAIRDAGYQALVTNIG